MYAFLRIFLRVSVILRIFNNAYLDICEQKVFLNNIKRLHFSIVHTMVNLICNTLFCMPIYNQLLHYNHHSNYFSYYLFISYACYVPVLDLNQILRIF